MSRWRARCGCASAMGRLEPVDVNRIVRAVSRCCAGLDGVDPMRVATRTISGLCDGASTEELDTLSIRTATALMAEEPNYSRLAARLLSTVIDKEVANQDIHSVFAVGRGRLTASGSSADDTAALRRPVRQETQRRHRHRA